MLTKISNPITWEELTSVLEYCQDTGVFTWKEKRSPKAVIGSVAGSTNSSGHIQIGLGGKQYLAHRLAWLYCFKEWPLEDLDHIDRSKQHNAINNLRELSRSDNTRNTNSRSASGYKNVYIDKKKFIGRVWINNKWVPCGRFDTPEKANQAVLDYKIKNNILI